MPVKHYGIFIAYPPLVDLRKEGLGRHLAAFLKGAAKRSDVRFVVACPSWAREGILKLCESEGIEAKSFDLIAPLKPPIILRVYLYWRSYWLRPKRERKPRLIYKSLARLQKLLEERVVSARSLLAIFPMIGAFVILLILLSVMALAGILQRLMREGLALSRKREQPSISGKVRQERAGPLGNEREDVSIVLSPCCETRKTSPSSIGYSV